MATEKARPLGVMVVAGYPKVTLEGDLGVARSLGVDRVEVLPLWSDAPNPREVAGRIAGSGLAIWSVHGPWGGQAIRAARVDLASLDEETRRESLDDVRRAMEWSAMLGAQVMVVHPGGFSHPEEHAARATSLLACLETLGNEAAAMGLTLGVENMPPGVHPGSRMSDLADLVVRCGKRAVGLVLDSGHAHIAHTASGEALATRTQLVSTHIHDNDGRQDSHQVPGEGSLPWSDFVKAINSTGYGGPFILECIRALRKMGDLELKLLAERLHGMLGSRARTEPPEVVG